MTHQKKNRGHRTSWIVKSTQSYSNGHFPINVHFTTWCARGRCMTWRVSFVHSKDAQKQLARTSLRMLVGLHATRGSSSKRYLRWELYPNTHLVWPKEEGFLLKRLGEDSDRIPGTIIVCCVLHNICVLRGDQLNISVSDGNDDNGTPPLWGCSCGFTSPCSIHCKSISSIPWFCPHHNLNYTRLWNNYILTLNLFKQLFIWSDLSEPEVIADWIKKYMSSNIKSMKIV